MKKFLFALIFIGAFSFVANSQVDTTLIKGGYKILPVEVDRFTKDTANQFTFTVFGVKSDTSQPANSYIEFWNKKKKKVLEKNLVIPASILKLWTDDIIIVEWICQNFGLTKLE